MSASHEEAACDVAHGTAPAPSAGRVLVAVFATPVAGFLLRYGSDAGYRAVLVEPDTERAKASQCDAELAAAVGDYGESADVVVTDHHRPELGIMLRDALASHNAGELRAGHGGQASVSACRVGMATEVR